MIAPCFEPLLPALKGAVSIYDRGTAQHCTRVANAAAAMAQALDLSVDQVEAVSWSGLLHDVGKLGVSVEVLQKSGPLTEVEWVEIRRHPVVGANLVIALSPQLAPIAAAIRSHHERWDGNGYPDRLAGTTIPLLGRIIAVADVFDALTHRRPYRAYRLNPAHAIQEIQRGASTHFDATLSATFIDLYHQGAILADAEC